MEFKKDQIFKTKKGYKLEISEVRVDKDGNQIGVEVKLFVHRDSKNCKSYGWGHNMKYFISNLEMYGRLGIIDKINKGGYKLVKEKKKVVASITNED